MNYELAKKLKEANFPLLDRIGYAYIAPDRIGFFTDGQHSFEKDWIYIPTLSELIVACGDKFYGLHRMLDGKWLAFIYDRGEKGSSKEEAVALLWLSLQK